MISGRLGFELEIGGFDHDHVISGRRAAAAASIILDIVGTIRPGSVTVSPARRWRARKEVT
jgi:hypothetical protein